MKTYEIFRLKLLHQFKDAGRIIGVNIILGTLFYVFKTSVPLEMYISGTGEAFLCAFLWMGLDALIFSKDIKRYLTILKPNNHTEVII